MTIIKFTLEILIYLFIYLFIYYFYNTWSMCFYFCHLLTLQMPLPVLRMWLQRGLELVMQGKQIWTILSTTYFTTVNNRRNCINRTVKRNSSAVQ